MAEAGERPSSRAAARKARVPGLSDLADVSEEMIAFVETYMKVWESEAKAMLALGEFMGGRAESMRYQVEMMRMGSGAFRRYVQWSEALMSLRPDVLLQSFLRPSPRDGCATSQGPVDERGTGRRRRCGGMPRRGRCYVALFTP